MEDNVFSAAEDASGRLWKAVGSSKAASAQTRAHWPAQLHLLVSLLPACFFFKMTPGLKNTPHLLIWLLTIPLPRMEATDGRELCPSTKTLSPVT